MRIAVAQFNATVGDYDFIVKIYARSTIHLLDLVRRQIKPLGAILAYFFTSGPSLIIMLPPCVVVKWT